MRNAMHVHSALNLCYKTRESPYALPCSGAVHVRSTLQFERFRLSPAGLSHRSHSPRATSSGSEPPRPNSTAMWWLSCRRASAAYSCNPYGKSLLQLQANTCPAGLLQTKAVVGCALPSFVDPGSLPDCVSYDSAARTHNRTGTGTGHSDWVFICYRQYSGTVELHAGSDVVTRVSKLLLLLLVSTITFGAVGSALDRQPPPCQPSALEHFCVLVHPKR